MQENQDKKLNLSTIILIFAIIILSFSICAFICIYIANTNSKDEVISENKNNNSIHNIVNISEESTSNVISEISNLDANNNFNNDSTNNRISFDNIIVEYKIPNGFSLEEDTVTEGNSAEKYYTKENGDYRNSYSDMCYKS